MQKKDDKSDKIKVLRLVREDGAYGLIEYELDSNMFHKYAKQVGLSQPDVFAVFMTNITKKCRDVFGI